MIESMDGLAKTTVTAAQMYFERQHAGLAPKGAIWLLPTSAEHISTILMLSHVESLPCQLS